MKDKARSSQEPANGSSTYGSFRDLLECLLGHDRPSVIPAYESAI
jgi:hypothetical protein